MENYEGRTTNISGINEKSETVDYGNNQQPEIVVGVERKTENSFDKTHENVGGLDGAANYTKTLSPEGRDVESEKKDILGYNL